MLLIAACRIRRRLVGDGLPLFALSGASYFQVEWLDGRANRVSYPDVLLDTRSAGCSTIVVHTPVIIILMMGVGGNIEVVPRDTAAAHLITCCGNG